MLKVLVIEDEKDISDLIKAFLTTKGMEITVVESGEQAKELLSHSSFDLFIVDRMLPGIDGIEVCKFLRSHDLHASSPLIFVTALGSPENIIEGLDAGADDYIAKPFDLSVLFARIQSVLRRYQILENQTQGIIRFESISLDVDARKAFVSDEEIKLTKSEYQILQFLLQNLKKVVSRKELVSFIQGDSVHVTERTIDTHMAALRKKIGDCAKFIETIRGVGYRIDSK